MQKNRAISIMLVDDSATVRGVISRYIEKSKGMEVVAKAFNGNMALKLAEEHKPDFIILDIEMPLMDGITALPKLLEISPNSKVIMASTLTVRNAGISMEALKLGASDYIAKPTSQDSSKLNSFYEELKTKIIVLNGSDPADNINMNLDTSENEVIKEATSYVDVNANYNLLDPEKALPRIDAIAIASSTGGPQALLEVFKSMKNKFSHVPIFITQHMPPVFTAVLAGQIEKVIEQESAEAVDGELVVPGKIYVAPGDRHMTVKRKDDNVVIKLLDSAPINFCIPAADPMFDSLSEIYGRSLLGVVLTGMGSDGLSGAKNIVKNGGSIVAQDKETSVVWGMPAAVATNNLCRAVLPLNEIAGYLIKQAGE